MDEHELSAWLRLVLTPHVGPILARRLLAALGSPQAVFAASRFALGALVSDREAQALAKEPAELAAQLALTSAWLASDPACQLITLADPRYPAALLDLANPPLILFAQGDLSLLQGPAVAIVGSRHPTPQGLDNARAFAHALSAVGVVVVSGMALGIDAAAHEGGLSGAPSAPQCGRSGGTIAVVGTGLDVVYPRRHATLAKQLRTHALVLSEFLLGTPPLSPNFPKRNRIVAALARGTLVVEAAVQSGSLITARLAAEMGREVLAIPGSIHSPQSRGCHALIKQGAKLVETAQDVLDELHLERPVLALSALSAERADRGGAGCPGVAVDESGIDPILQAMGFDPVSQEALSARTGWGPAELGGRLLELELMGQVARLPGQLFQRQALA
jgi:DNA processing protein